MAKLSLLFCSLLVVLLAAAACGGGDAMHSAEPQKLVLHPRDLARGYEYGDDTVCGTASATEGDWPKLMPLFAEERPNSCINELQWVWSGAPTFTPGVTSAAYVFQDADGARRAFRARDELAVFTATLDVRRREALELGDEAELLRGEGLNDPASGVVWRDENVVAVVVVEPVKDDAARELARRQQRRIERPSLPAAAGNDPALQLDDPALRIPVHWLGRSFDPPGALPPLKLDLANVGGSGPGQIIQLWYGVVGVPDTVSLDTWEPNTWRRFRRTLLGRLIWDSPCARKKIVRVEGGRAEIFDGYGDPKPVELPCPQRPRDRVVAHVYYRDVVLVVNMPYCYVCARPEPRPSPYDTVEATELLVRSLRIRPRRR